MNKIKGYSLAFLSVFAFAQESQGATVAPPISEQLQEVVELFTGEFDNSQQVAGNPAIPLVTMDNCSVDMVGSSSEIMAQEAVYLEQTTGGSPLRVRFYGFNPGTTGVDLSISPFVEESFVLGTCDQPPSEQVVNLDNVVTESCDLVLNWDPIGYIANNAPEGCPTSFPGGKVISEVEIRPDGIDSLDQIFDAEGNLLFGTLIEFRSTSSVPEPSSIISLLAFAAIGYRKFKAKSTERLD